MPTLRVEAPERPPYEVELHRDALTIGRATDSDLSIPSLSLSRRHARLVQRAGGYVVEDLGSRNGTFVNGAQIQGPTSVSSGDEIRCGDVRLHMLASVESVKVLPDGGLSTPSDTYVLNREQLNFRRYAEQSRSGSSPKLGDATLWPALNDAAATLITHYPLERLLEVVMDIVFRAVHADRGALMLRREDGELEARVVRVPPGAPPLQISRTVVQQVMNEHKGVLTLDALTDDRFDSAQSIRIQGVRSVICVPLWNEQNVTGLIYADNQIADGAFSQSDLRLLGLIANMAAVKVENSRLLAEQIEKERLEEQLEVAAQIQRRLLPQKAPEVAGWEVRGTSQPCYEIGGDYYDYLRLASGKLGLVIADVSGKGVGAALLMAAFQASLRALAGSCRPEELLARLNQVMFENSPPAKYVTAFYGELDPSSGEFLYVNAGHNAPLLVRGGRALPLEATGPVVGLLPQAAFTVGRERLERGDLLFLYTDGVTECENTAEAEYGFDRLTALVERRAADDLGALTDELLDDLARFSAGAPRKDDTTAVLVRRA
jgi:serine phosphatase RsbU (regulator of sigma subunit)